MKKAEPTNFRFNTADAVRGVAVWRIPEMIGAVINLFWFFLIVGTLYNIVTAYPRALKDPISTESKHKIQNEVVERCKARMELNGYNVLDTYGPCWAEATEAWYKHRDQILKNRSN